MDGFLRQHGELLLVIVGFAAMVGGLTADRDAVSVALIAVGAGLVAVGVLADRLEGPVKVGAQGFEGTLVAKVRESALKRGLSADQTELVLDRLLTVNHPALSDDLAELLLDAITQPDFKAVELSRDPDGKPRIDIERRS